MRVRRVLEPDNALHAERLGGPVGRSAERHRANARGVRGQGRKGEHAGGFDFAAVR